jgi:serine/threonine kinase PknH
MCDAARGAREGTQLGRYYLKRRIGCGGLGEVYEAEDTVEERIVALKLVPPAFSHDVVFCARLQRAARTAGRLTEPHVVPIYDSGEIDGQLFLDMRLIGGTDLARLLKGAGALAPPRAVAIVRQAASALDAAHAVGLVHGDVKPENILIGSDDFTYLVDFGVAAAAARDGLAQIVGSAVGTWKYTAPERFTDPVVNHEVDIYALTCVLYECVTGLPPYQADSSGDLASAHLMERIPQPSQLQPGLSGAFDDVIARGMAKDPQERYATAGDLALAADEALRSEDQDRVDQDLCQDRVGQVITSSQQEQQEQEVALLDTDPGLSLGRHVPATSPGPSGAPGGALYHEPNTSESPTSELLVDPEALPLVAPTQELRAVPRFGLGNTGWPDEATARPPAPRSSGVLPPRGPARLLQGAAAVLAVIILSGVAIWLLRPSHFVVRNPSTMTSAGTVPNPPAGETQARLLSLLPVGYGPGTCKPVTPSKEALAKLSCDKNADPDGPPSADYTLFPDEAAQRDAFNRIVQTSSVVECPGHIRSPGPWHRNATPAKTSGMLLCGIQQENPLVAWTNHLELLLGVVHGGAQGPAIEQLYTWWTLHS